MWKRAFCNLRHCRYVESFISSQWTSKSMKMHWWQCLKGHLVLALRSNVSLQISPVLWFSRLLKFRHDFFSDYIIMNSLNLHFFGLLHECSMAQVWLYNSDGMKIIFKICIWSLRIILKSIIFIVLFLADLQITNPQLSVMFSDAHFSF